MKTKVIDLFQTPKAFAGGFFAKSNERMRRMATATLTVLACGLVAWPAAAATINWGTATTITGDTDVSANGAPFYAYTGGTAGTVNGVAFTAGSGFAAWGSVSFTSGFTGSTPNAYAPITSISLSDTYSNLLAGGAYGVAAAGTVTLNGLTPNEAYAVQIWVNDPRSAGVGRYETATNTVASASTATLIYNQYLLGSPGQYVIGTFFANSTSQSFTLIPSGGGSVQLNAISVRDLGGPNKIWLGSSDTSWGTSANWSPSGAPLAGQSVVFDNLSSANLATVPDQSYTLGTLSLSNAPAPVTIGSSGFTLNINGGINLFDPSQSLTINDPVALGSYQTWTNNGNLTINADVSGSVALTLAGTGVTTITQPATYLYKTTISGGTLALSGSGSLTSADIAVAGGATLDVSAETTVFALGGRTLENSSSGAVINGANDCTSGTLSLVFDGANPCFIQTNGTMTISSSTVITVNCSGEPLPAGTYTLIAAATTGNLGPVSGAVPTPTLTGNGAVGAASLVIDGSGNLKLVIATPDVWTGAVSGSWSAGGNWLPANEPNPGDSILFNNLSVANLNVSQNDTVSGGAIYGLSVLNPTGPVTISAPGNLSVYGGGLNLAAASQNLTIAAPLIINANQTWLITNSRNLTVSGPVSSSSGGNITVSGGGTVQMGAAHVLDGLTNNAGTCNFTVSGGKLDLNGYSQAMNGLNGSTSAVVDNSSASPVTLVIGGNGDGSTNRGVIQNSGGGALALQVNGGDVQLLATNTYSGGTIFNGGRLYLPNTSALSTGPVTFNPGSGAFTYGVTFTNALTLDAAYLHLGGDQNSQTWSGPVTVMNGFSMSGDNKGCTLTLSGPMNIGTGGISVTNFGNNGPQEGYQVSLTGDLLSGPISGSGGITYYLSGANSRLTLQGANTYTGGTIVNGDPANPGGKLNVYTGINNATNYCFSTGSVTLHTNAIIESAPKSTVITNALTLDGGTLQSEPQYNDYNTLTWAGPITLTADSALVQNAKGALNSDQSSGVNVSGSLNMNGFTLTCSSPVACYNGNILSGSISGAGTILENGNNNLTVSGSNTFSGTFRSVLGNLSVQNAYALQNATLDMNAADAGSVNLNNLNHVIGELTGSRNLSLGTGTVSIGNNNASTTYSGNLTGAGSLIKVGSGTLTLANNAYTGNTTVKAGTLSLAQPALALLSTVSVSNGAVLNLNFATTNLVVTLVLNGVSKPSGVYNSANSGGLITGTGAIQVGAYPYVWSGAWSSEWSINTLSSPKNWLYNLGQIDYADGNVVLFDDTLVNNSTVDISMANVSPALVSFNNNHTNYTIGGSFGIAGACALIKNGTNTVTLTTVNTYTGSTTISNGMLTIGDPGKLGNGSYAAVITNNGTLTYNSSASQTLSGIISGTGAINYLGTGGLTLSGVNTFGGGTTLANGTVYPGNGSAFGTGTVSINSGANTYPAATMTFTNPLVLNGGKLEIGGGSDTVTWSGPITTTPNGCWLVGDNAGNVFNLSGSMNIGTLGTSITNSGNSTQHSISGPISGSGGINFVLNGSRLALSASNSYSGGTVVNGTAKLNVQNNYAFGTGPVTNNGAIIEEYQANTTISNALTLNGGTLETDYLYNDYTSLTWTGPVNVTANSTLYCAGNVGSGFSTSGVRLNGPVTMNGFTLTSTGNSQYNGNQINGSISGTGLIQVSALSLTLGGSNSFSGTNRAVGGTLSVNNAYALQNATLDMNAADTGSVSLNNLNCIIGALQGSRNLSLGAGTVSIGNNNLSTTYTGSLSGNASLVKVGTGTLTLSSNAYTWNTTVNGGTLSIAQPNLAFASTVTVTNGAFLNLNFVGTNAVTALVLNGVSQPKGVYGSANSGGRLTGTGFIQVGTTPNIWTGAASGTWSTANIGTPYNWVSNSIAGNYADGSPVLFDDTLTANNVVLLTNTVSPIGVTFNNNNTNYTIGGSGSIGGSSGLFKNGAGSVTLTNNNTYTGNTIVNSNTLTIGNAGKLGNGAYAGNIYLANGATLEYNSISAQTLSGPITGAGGLLKDGATKVDLTLSSALNTYSGPTVITNGRVSVSAQGNIGGGTTIVQTNAGQLLMSAAMTLNNPMNLSSIGYPEADAYGNNFDGAVRCDATCTLSGQITLSGNARLGNYNGSGTTFTISGQITGNYGIEYYGMNGGANSRNFLPSNTGNNYTGNTTINCKDFSAARTGASTTLKLGASEVIPNGNGFGTIVFSGADANHLTILEMNGFNETINGVSNVSATGAIIRNTSTGASTLTIGDGNTNSIFSGLITDGGAGKTLGITKIGAGTLTLSASNTYSGITIISAGTLLANNTTGSATGTNVVNINNGGTLGGIGIISGSVTNNAGGTLSPGTNGVGTLTLSGNLKLLSGSTNTFAVNGSTPTNTSVALGAAVTYGGVLNIITNGTFTAGQTFTLFSGTGATNTSNFASIAGDPGSGKAFSFTNGVLSVVSAGPTLTSVTPNPITGSSYSVTLGLTGSGFTGATAVLLTNLTANAGASYLPTVNSDSSISVSFVPGTTASTWNATVVNGAPSSQVGFTVTVPAKVTINPAKVNSAGPGKLVLGGTGGVANDSYTVQSATNLNPPVIWSPVVTNKFDGSGNFSYTNTVNVGTPELFLRIQQ